MGKLTKPEISVLYSVLACVLVGICVNLFTGYAAKPVFSERRPKPMLVNINKAGLDELALIPGMGRANAGRTIDYREKNGPFTQASGILKVKGIGPKRYAKMKRYITVK